MRDNDDGLLFWGTAAWEQLATWTKEEQCGDDQRG